MFSDSQAKKFVGRKKTNYFASDEIFYRRFCRRCLLVLTRLEKLGEYLPSIRLDLISSLLYLWAGDKRDLEKSSFKANQVLHQLILDVVGKVTLGGHLYPLINKAKKKSNQVSYLVSIHLIFPFSYALFMSWINETLKLDWCKTCRMSIVDIITLCKVIYALHILY